MMVMMGVGCGCEPGPTAPREPGDGRGSWVGAGATGETFDLSASFRLEWSTEMKRLCLDNSLVNVSGRVGGWMEMDRFQEGQFQTVGTQMVIFVRRVPTKCDFSKCYINEIG